MSGFVAVLDRSGAPVEELGRSLAASVVFRGRDRQGFHSSGNVAFAHALFATFTESARDVQPLLHGALTVVADARLDAREELVARVGALKVATDAELIALAYEQSLLDELEGDFAFVVWDGARRRLVAMRDRLGLRPLYFAQVRDLLLVTNNLPTLLESPLIERALDRDALSEFLVHGYNTDAARTTWRQIRRVPPAHRLVATADALSIERWWTMPFVAEPLRIREAEASERFREIFGRAVRDRARGGPLAISLSGGVDSTSIAGTLVAQQRHPHAITSVWDDLIPDVERQWATQAAQALSLPIDFHVCDDYVPFERWADDAFVRGFEPKDEPLSAVFTDFMRRAATHGRVLMTGQGGDPALYASHGYFAALLRRGRLVRFAFDALHYTLTRGQRPPLLLRSKLRRLFARPQTTAAPPWMRPTVAARWKDVPTPLDPRIHSWRPEAWSLLMLPVWPVVFESFDAGATGVPLDLAAPYFDPRLLQFLLSLPPMPHFADKDLVRRSMRGLLPDTIRLRPKTPLMGNPLVARAAEWRAHLIRIVDEAPPLFNDLVDGRIIRKQLEEDGFDPQVAQQYSVPLSLAAWLRSTPHSL